MKNWMFYLCGGVQVQNRGIPFLQFNFFSSFVAFVKFILKKRFEVSKWFSPAGFIQKYDSNFHRLEETVTYDS